MSKRTLTVYVVRHAQDAPMRVCPTIKAANEYLQYLEDDNNGHPLCSEWRTEACSFMDNSTGAANMMSWLLGECADELISGYNAQRELDELNTPINELAAKEIEDIEHAKAELSTGNPEVKH